VAATAAVSTSLSGAAGGISALLTNLYIQERRTGEPQFSLFMAMNGALAGLVGVTSGCGVIEPWAAVVVGIVAGWTYLYASNLLLRSKIDDAVDAIPVHMCCGIWGVLATGLFASPHLMETAYGTGEFPGLFYALANGSYSANLLACQVCLICFIVGWVFCVMMPFFIWLNYKGWFRADSLEELVGLDISYHGGMDMKDGSVKKEYIEAFKRHKGAIRNRRQNHTQETNGSDRGWNDSGGEGDPDFDQEAAAEEAYRAGE
jgi:Amt family ammonium transporter